MKILRGGTLKPCVEHEIFLSKQLLADEEITETISIAPGISKQITFTCQIVHQIGGQEKIIGDPLVVAWKSSEPLLNYDVVYDKNTGGLTCTVAKGSTEPLEGVELHYKCKTLGLKFHGQLLDQEQVIPIEDLPAQDKSVKKNLGTFDWGNNQYVEFDFWLFYKGGPNEYAKKSLVFTSADVCLEISELSYDLEKNHLIYRIQNKGQDLAQELKLHYTNTSRDDMGSTVLIGNDKEGTINLESIPGGGCINGALALETQSATKFKVGLKLLYKNMVLNSLCIDVILPKLRLLSTVSDFLIGANKTIQFKIKEENEAAIDLSRLSLVVKSADGGVKLFYQGAQITKELLATNLGGLDHPIEFSIESGEATQVSIEIQLVYYGKLAASQTFTWQHDVSQATKDLFEAIAWGAISKIGDLLQEGKVQINATHEEGEGFLWNAALNGNREAVLALLKAPDIDVNTKNTNSKSSSYGYSLLQLYVQQGDLVIVSELLGKGAKINDRVDDLMGYTSLHLAIANQDVKMLGLLLQDPSTNPNMPDKSGDTPLSLAICRENQEAIDQLIAKKADVNAVDNFGRSPLHMLISYQGKDETVRKLLQHGADVNAVDHFGRTPWELAIQKRNIATIKQLIATPIISTNQGSDDVSNSCLHAIVAAGDTATVEQIISLVGVNMQDGYGNTLLHYTVRQRDETIGSLLIEKGADRDLKNNQQQSSKDWFHIYFPDNP